MTKFILLLIAVLPMTIFANEDQTWSKVSNGLKVRLSFNRIEKTPFLRVYLEFKNVSDIQGVRSLRFTPKKLNLKIVDSDGKELQKAHGLYSVLTAGWEPLTLPFDGLLKFRITFPGLGYGATDRTIVDLGPSMAWVVPNDGKYFISGSIVIPPKKGDRSHYDWSGTLTIPKTNIPQPKTQNKIE